MSEKEVNDKLEKKDEVTDNSEISNEEPKILSKKDKFVKEAKSIFWIVFLVLMFRSVLFEPFRIPSGSMIPTLMIGDFILVNKFSYGIKVPFSDWFSDPIYLYERDRPEKGDVIVFKFPKDKNINYIKRVVGGPGDTIEIKNKVVYVNDKAITPKLIDGKKIMSDMDDKFKNYSLKFFELENGKHVHNVMVDTENFYKVDMMKRTIPKDKFFVMGDNRDFSFDSRFWGFVPFENIKGEALFVWFAMIIPILDDNPFKFRPWRIGTSID